MLVPALTGAERPIALETLEVTLGRVDAYLRLTLVDPELDDLRRRARLIELAPLRDRSSTQWVEELALDPTASGTTPGCGCARCGRSTETRTARESRPPLSLTTTQPSRRRPARSSSASRRPAATMIPPHVEGMTR